MLGSPFLAVKRAPAIGAERLADRFRRRAPDRRERAGSCVAARGAHTCRPQRRPRSRAWCRELDLDRLQSRARRGIATSRREAALAAARAIRSRRRAAISAGGRRERKAECAGRLLRQRGPSGVFDCGAALPSGLRARTRGAALRRVRFWDGIHRAATHAALGAALIALYERELLR